MVKAAVGWATVVALVVLQVVGLEVAALVDILHVAEIKANTTLRAAVAVLMVVQDIPLHMALVLAVALVF
jgi:hypothetical protein